LYRAAGLVLFFTNPFKKNEIALFSFKTLNTLPLFFISVNFFFTGKNIIIILSKNDPFGLIINKYIIMRMVIRNYLRYIRFI